MKKSIILLLLGTVIIFTACTNNTKDILLPEPFNRNVPMLISKSDLLEHEPDLTFSIESSRSEQSDKTIEYYFSNKKVNVGDYSADIEYVFSQDKLIETIYDIDIVYPKTEVSNIPSYIAYTDLKKSLVSSYGEPIEQDKPANDYILNEYYYDQWETEQLEIFLRCIQSTDNPYLDAEVVDNVYVSFKAKTINTQETIN